MRNHHKLNCFTIQQMVEIIESPEHLHNSYYLKLIENTIIEELEKRLNITFNLLDISILKENYSKAVTPCQIKRDKDKIKIILGGELAFIFISIIKDCGFDYNEDSSDISPKLFSKLWQKEVHNFEELIEEVEELTNLIDKLVYLT